MDLPLPDVIKNTLAQLKKKNNGGDNNEQA
jgi:hypothetical protein